MSTARFPSARFPSGAPSIPPWQVLYQDAILEFDDTKLSDRISRARDAIRDRAQELPDPSERRLLDNALQSLHMLEEIMARKHSAQESRAR